MSKVIDERVVEMQFNNKDFEKNVQTSMSTLDKLKSKLNLKGAAKGIEKLDSAAKKVDMKGLGSAVETVHAKFSALEVMGVTALANITNSAVNAGKRIVSALTIDPVKTGFSEYETQINAIQTILANTESKGTTLTQVTAALDELNTYADKTIYNFTEMTRNIGTFTAAGVDLETSVKAIQGIANLAAISGSTSQQASTAMYQLSQALASGTVKLMDWNSVVNAGMGGQVFQDALKETARVHGVAIDQMIKEQGSFRETLSEGWITADILTETLEKFTLSSENMTEAEIAANRERLKSIGYTDAQIEGIFKLGNTATNAATKVKTLTQLWDVTKEAAQSGWAKSWQIIIGDFEESKTLWSSVSDSITGVINKMSDARNAMLEDVFGSKAEKNWKKITKQINEAGISTKDFQKVVIKTAKKHGVSIDKMIKDQGSFEKTLESGWLTKGILIEAMESYTQSVDDASKSTEDMTATLEKFRKVVADVWHGDYKNGAARIEALTKAGYDYAEVQALVNKTVNDHKLDLEDLSEAQLKSAGYTDKQIGMLKELAEEARNSGSSLEELIDEMSRPSGRFLLLDALSNFGEEFGKLLDGIKEAWDEIFGDVDVGEILYNAIEHLHELSEAFNISETSAENFKTVCEGAFAIFQLGTSLFSMSMYGGLKILSAVLEVFGTNLLEVMSIIAEYIIKFRDWVNEHTIFINTWDKIGTILGVIIKGVRSCVDAFMELKVVKKLISDVKEAISDFFDKFDFGVNGLNLDSICTYIENIFRTIRKWIESLDDSENIGRDIVLGLANGIRSGISAAVDAIMSVGAAIYNAICGFFGIASPSRLMMAVGAFIVLGLIAGLMGENSALMNAITSFLSNFEFLEGSLSTFGENVKKIASMVMDIIQGTDWGALLIVGTIIASLFLFNKMLTMMEKVLDRTTKPIQKILNPLTKLGNLFDTIGTTITKNAKAERMEKYSRALKNLAIAIGILAASVYLLAQLDTAKLWISVGAIATLAAVLGVLTFAVAKIDPDKFVGFAGLSLFLFSLGASLSLMASAMRKLSEIDSEGANTAVKLLITLVGSLALLMIAFGKFVKGPAAANISKAGTMFIKLAITMMLMAMAIKLISTISPYEAKKGIQVIAAITLLYGALIFLFGYVGNTGKSTTRTGSMLLKMSMAILLLVGVIKLINTLSNGEIAKGLLVIAAIEIMFAAFIFMFKFLTANSATIAKSGGMFLKMSIAIGALALTMKLIASMSMHDISKGLAFIAAVEMLFLAYIGIANVISGEQVGKAGGMLMKMAVGIALLGLAIKIIATIDGGDIAKGLITIGLIEALFLAIVYISQFAGEHASSAGSMIMKMSLAILILVGAIALISLLDPKDVAIGTAAISALLGMFALILRMSEYTKDCMKTLIVMAVAIGILGGVLITLSCLDSSKVAVASAAITAVLGAFALLTVATKYAQPALGAMIILTVAVAALAGILYLFSGLPVESTLGTATALSILLLAMSVSFKILSTAISPTIGTALLGLAGMIIAVGLLAGIFALMSHFDVEPSIEVAMALSTLLLAMSGALVLLGVVGMMGPAAFIGLGALATLIVGLGALIVGIGALNEKFPQLETFLNSGIPVLEKIGYALGSFFGNIIGGFTSGLTTGFPQMANDLSQFITNLQPFIDGVKNIDPGVADGVKSLATAILALTGANFIESITSWATGGNSLANFGEQLVPFGESMAAYSNAVAGVNTEAITASASAAKALAEVANALPNEGGVASWFAGDNTLSQFATNLIPFGFAMVSYSQAVAGVNTEAITASASAAKALVEVANSIPKEGGLMAWISGENTLAQFATHLVPFATGMKAYATEVVGLDSESITASIPAARSLMEVAALVPKDGWLGMDGIDDFGMNLTTFGSCMKKYATEVTDLNSASIMASIPAARALLQIAALVPDDGSMGMDGIDDFGKNIKKFGKKLKDYSEEVADVDTGAISSSVSAAKKVIGLVEIIPSESTDIGSFTTNLKKLGKALKSFSDKVDGIDLSNVSSIAKSLNSLTAAVKKTAGLQEAINNLGKISLNKLNTSFSGAKVTNIGTKLVTNLAKGIKSKSSAVVNAMKSVVNNALIAAKSKQASFVSAGRAMAQGFANGISSGSFSAAVRARAMAQAAVQAAKNALKINSPSKVFYAIGAGVPEGFINALNDSAKSVYNASYDMAGYAEKGFTKAVAGLASVINDDIDAQPTIRPILDLSDIKSGAGAISSMLDVNPSVGVMANVGAISTSFNRNQNGVNSDVVSAIKDLGKKLSGTSGDTYHINGITYDDGSNITDAVESLIRAARLQRRV